MVSQCRGSKACPGLDVFRRRAGPHWSTAPTSIIAAGAHFSTPPTYTSGPDLWYVADAAVLVCFVFSPSLSLSLSLSLFL